MKSAAMFFPNNWQPIAAGEPAVVTKIQNDDELAGAQAAVKRLRTKIGVAKGFGKPAVKEEEQLRLAEEAIAQYESARRAAKEKRESNKKLPPGFAVLRDFYEQISLLPSDEKVIFEKRGLSSRTIELLGIKSNLKSHRDLLLGFREHYKWRELLRSGLWLPEKKGRESRPNDQFCGLVQICKKPAGLRKKKDDKWVWGWLDEGWCSDCQKLFKLPECPKGHGKLKAGGPYLIPYFNSRGELMKLRPHKGGAPSNTVAGESRLYIPRGFGSDFKNSDRFRTVVVTEGEFKAAALWQALGDGSDEAEPIGVCALPGISYGKNFELRSELAMWLRRVGCGLVIVAFDQEEKGDPKLPGYQADRRARYDAEVWARFLGESLHEEIKVRAQLAMLPRAWRDQNGKADWDGAAAKLLKGVK